MSENALLQRVADELDIRGLLARTAQHSDLGEIADYLRSFTDDVEWVGPMGTVNGTDGVRENVEKLRAIGGSGPGSGRRHMLATCTVDLDGDRATAVTYWTLFSGAGTPSPVAQAVGRYEDTFTRTPGGWRMSRRVVHTD